MRISIIIPVYKAEAFLTAAIDSALTQRETAEVILVEDNSPDRCYQICQEYADKDRRVRVFRHPDGQNHGAGASFNLGIRQAREEFVAFLGADDQFVPDAFAFAREMFSRHRDADGIYAYIGAVYHEPEFRQLHLKRVPHEVSGMNKPVPPEALLAALLKGDQGHISFDSIVLRRSILTEDFLFDEDLRQGQDTDLLYRLAGRFRLYGPDHERIVALRGVHAGNRVFKFDEAKYFQRQLLAKCIRNHFYGCIDESAKKAVIYRYLKSDVEKYSKFIPASLVRRILYHIYRLKWRIINQQ